MLCLFMVAGCIVASVDSYGFKYTRPRNSNDCRLQVHLPGHALEASNSYSTTQTGSGTSGNYVSSTSSKGSYDDQYEGGSTYDQRLSSNNRNANNGGWSGSSYNSKVYPSSPTTSYHHHHQKKDGILSTPGYLPIVGSSSQLYGQEEDIAALERERERETFADTSSSYTSSNYVEPAEVPASSYGERETSYGHDEEDRHVEALEEAYGGGNMEYSSSGSSSNYADIPLEEAGGDTGYGHGGGSSSSAYEYQAGNYDDQAFYGGQATSHVQNPAPIKIVQKDTRAKETFHEYEYDKDRVSEAENRVSTSSHSGDRGHHGQGSGWTSSSADQHHRHYDGGGGSRRISIDGQFARDVLDAHNFYREKHQAGPLILDDKLTEKASNLAKTLAASSSSGTPIWHSEGALRGEFGESIATHSNAGLSGGDAVDFWYKEVRNFDFKRPRLKSSPPSESNDNFTALVWAGSRKLGVGRAVTREGKLIVVATYFPGGNNPRGVVTNVFPSRRTRG